MSNPYILILSFFVIVGLLTTAWGWSIIMRGRKTQNWPQTEGLIEQSEAASDADDLLPQIVFSYTVANNKYRRELKFPSGLTPTPQLSTSYVEKYPVGARVPVYYHPKHPGRATLEPGLGRGDWMVFGFGLATTVVGVLFLVVGD